MLIVDDSALMRVRLTEIIEEAPDHKVVGAAPDPSAARELIPALSPNGLTLDVETPRISELELGALGHPVILRLESIVML